MTEKSSKVSWKSYIYTPNCMVLQRNPSEVPTQSRDTASAPTSHAMYFFCISKTHAPLNALVQSVIETLPALNFYPVYYSRACPICTSFIASERYMLLLPGTLTSSRGVYSWSTRGWAFTCSVKLYLFFSSFFFYI